MIRFDHLALRRGLLLLLNDVTVSLHAGWRVGITGRNGAGKSSLLALVAGEITPDAGHFERPRDWTLAYVRQEVAALNISALDYALDGDTEFRQIERDLAKAEATHDGVKLGSLHERLHAIGGYAARARAAELLHGLGFAPGSEHRNVAEFSGGWRMRLNLAQALMCRSDLLLLDEPTNHLDLDAVLWLETWLKRYPGTLLLISHDREFLDAVVDAIVHVDALKLRAYTGNYSQFERERAAQLSLQQASYAKQQRQIAHLTAFVERFRAKATKAKQAQSRVKALERMERIAAAHVDSPFEFTFSATPITARQLVRLTHVTLGYGDAPP